MMSGARRLLARHFIDLPQHWILNGFRLLLGTAALRRVGMKRFSTLGLAPWNGNSKFYVLNVVTSTELSEALHNLARQPVQLSLPDCIFDFHDECGSHQPYIRRVRGDRLSYRDRPGCTCQFFIGENPPGMGTLLNQPRSTFHLCAGVRVTRSSECSTGVWIQPTAPSSARIASAMRTVHFSTSASDAASIITRASGSVPEKRTTTRPLPANSRSAAWISAWTVSSSPSGRLCFTRTFTSFCGNVFTSPANASSV